MSTPLEPAVQAIRAAVPAARPRSLLVALSGIDGSGKTTLARRLAARLESHGLAVACIGVDPWQNPRSIRFGGVDPGAHFYRHAIRFDDLFRHLVRPLVDERRIHLVTFGIRTDSDVYDELVYRHAQVDVVLLEGIFLLQERFDALYGLRLWIDCPFDLALERALARNAEHLPEARLRDEYATVYHAAQRHHFAVDDPLSRADLVIDNRFPLH